MSNIKNFEVVCSDGYIKRTTTLIRTDGSRFVRVEEFAGNYADKYIKFQEKLVKYAIKELTKKRVNSKPISPKHSLIELFKSAISKPKRNGELLSSKSQSEQMMYFKRVIEMLGMKETSDYSRLTPQKIREFEKKVYMLPNNLAELLKTGMSIHDILNMKNTTKMSIKSINKHLSIIKKITTEATTLYPNLYPTNLGNIIKECKYKKSDNAYLRFSDKHLSKLFSHYFKIDEPEYFFPPLISLYTGSRKNSCLTLKYCDIKIIDDIWCFNFNESGENKHLKNEASKRIVPIHKDLLEIGFIEWLKKYKEVNQADDNSVIFKNIYFSTGTLDNDKFYKVFSDKLEELHIKPTETESGKLSFHSLRDTFSVNCEACGITPNFIDALGGWKERRENNIRDKFYFKPNIYELANELNKLKYLSFDTVKDKFRKEIYTWVRKK